MYKQITSLSKNPIFIMTGTSEFSRDGDIANKADWINDAFIKIKNTYMQIEIVLWFNYKYSEKINWRIDSSKESLIAFNGSIS